MKPRALGFVLLAAASTSSARTRADETAACVQAASGGQRLRNAHQLVEARDSFRVCARPSCPGVVVADCVEWLKEVEADLPTVVLAATDRSGVEHLNVRVRVDGQLLAERIDGRSIPIDPGQHVFHFTFADGSETEQSVLVVEGRRDQLVSGVMPTPAGRVAAGPALEPASPAAVTASTPWRTAGWVLGGAGVVGLGLGTAFGLVGLAAKGSDCTGTVCLPGTLGQLRTDAAVSDAGLFGGGALLVTGVSLLLFSSRGPASSTRAVSVTPNVTAKGSSITLRAVW